ncbi:hypothetical protein LCGC14_3086050 [marine sediment metagenome]|uniref:Nuclease associated modular domain-containing protein n=1 Tax=marine sediment metagenome TaxID=412755 RepID=A0A0F8YJF7_9ZZZZ
MWILNMDTYRKRRIAYLGQRSNAEQRNISWQFNYVTWIRKWYESGKITERGKKSKEYCMARIGDIGPYSYNNTKIITNNQNVRDSLIGNKRRLGIPNSRAARAKIGKSSRGNTHALGNKHTDEFKRKMSERMMGNKYASKKTKEKGYDLRTRF